MAQFRDAYANELFRRSNNPNDSEYGRRRAMSRAESYRVADQTISTFHRLGGRQGGGSQWFASDQAVRDAAKKIGIRSAPEFGAFVVAESGPRLREE